MKGGIYMKKLKYEKPELMVLTMDDIVSYSRDHRHCSGCGGKCHRGNS